MPSFEVLLFRLLLVLIVGGLIGAEREYRSKSAGFRTMILICLGSFLYTIFSISISGSTSDRIASNIVTGIGFLGAGVIYQNENRIEGITTAASIWITAALGMGIGSGDYYLVIGSTVVVLIALFFLTRLEDQIEYINQSKIYKITYPYEEGQLYKYEEVIKESGLRYKRLKKMKSGDLIIGSWLVKGNEKAHKRFVERILQDSFVKEFEF